ncbi:MAG TPA: hypothetical protein V6D13_20015 [Halomicronema sp.]
MTVNILAIKTIYLPIVKNVSWMLWNLSHGSQLTTLKNDCYWINSIAFIPNSQTLSAHLQKVCRGNTNLE